METHAIASIRRSFASGGTTSTSEVEAGAGAIGAHVGDGVSPWQGSRRTTSGAGARSDFADPGASINHASHDTVFERTGRSVTWHPDASAARSEPENQNRRGDQDSMRAKIEAIDELHDPAAPRG